MATTVEQLDEHVRASHRRNRVALALNVLAAFTDRDGLISGNLLPAALWEASRSSGLAYSEVSRLADQSNFGMLSSPE